jgi:hypothetical protein
VKLENAVRTVRAEVERLKAVEHDNHATLQARATARVERVALLRALGARVGWPG